MPKKTASVIGALAITAGALSVFLADDSQSSRVAPGPISALQTRDTPVVLQATHQVTIKNLQFSPVTMNIAVGDTVTWTNNETDGTVHNVTSDDGNSFVSPEIPQGGTFSYTASSPGTFAYHCRFHPQTTGTLNVGGGAPPAEPPPPPPPPPAPEPPPPAPEPPPPPPAPEPPAPEPPPEAPAPSPGLPGLPALPLPGVPKLPDLPLPPVLGDPIPLPAVPPMTLERAVPGAPEPAVPALPVPVAPEPAEPALPAVPGVPAVPAVPVLPPVAEVPALPVAGVPEPVVPAASSSPFASFVDLIGQIVRLMLMANVR